MPQVKISDSARKNNTAGIHYETPEGRIAYVYGLSNIEVSYYYDDGKAGRTASLEVFDTWKERRDLKDFHNTSDPRLPYEFDLNWDVKHVSELKLFLQDHEDNKAMFEAMVRNNISLDGVDAVAESALSNKVLFQQATKTYMENEILGKLMKLSRVSENELDDEHLLLAHKMCQKCENSGSNGGIRRALFKTDRDGNKNVAMYFYLGV